MSLNYNVIIYYGYGSVLENLVPCEDPLHNSLNLSSGVARPSDFLRREFRNLVISKIRSCVKSAKNYLSECTDELNHWYIRS